MARILVVEDHRDVRRLLVEALSADGYETTVAADGLEARRALESAGDRYPFELVVLDLMLPYVDGSVLLQELRRRSDVPVLVLSAKDAVVTKIDILRLGADDYVTKPFDLAEVSARVGVLLRRTKQPDSGLRVLRHGDLELDVSGARASVAGHEVPLTATEQRILGLLMEMPGRVHSRSAIYESVWGEPFVGDHGAVKTHVSNLRAKLRVADPGTEHIETVWGLGYRAPRL
ncbi:response regulator transcription factor [Quadrisphaera sp. GCM10027208]|uniref:response regulator transcription factor n=1 Tax=Quadrisphaera sp. GCM10027208 TaxID=3273423 RepID=UPI00360F98C0